MKRLHLVMISLVFSLMATYVLWKRIHEREEAMSKSLKTVDIVVSGTEIKPGDVLTYDNLRVLAIPEAGYSSRMIKAEEFQDIEGAICANRIPKGNPIIWDDIKDPIETDRFSKTITEGKRAVTITADEKMTFSGLLKPGDKVDVITTRGTDENRISSVLLLENVPVVAVSGRYSGEILDESEGGTITLMLSPIQAAALIQAVNDPLTKLYFTLRNPKDRRTRAGKKQKTRSIEFYAMGVLEKTLKVKQPRSKGGKK